MSDRPDQEGWGVPQRLPLIAAGGTLLLLLGALTLFGALYRTRMEASTRPPPIHLPAPQLETIRTPPDRPRRDNAQPPPPGIDRAMAELAARGDALWGGAKP